MRRTGPSERSSGHSWEEDDAVINVKKGRCCTVEPLVLEAEVVFQGVWRDTLEIVMQVVPFRLQNKTL